VFCMSMCVHVNMSNYEHLGWAETEGGEELRYNIFMNMALLQ